MSFLIIFRFISISFRHQVRKTTFHMLEFQNSQMTDECRGKSSLNSSELREEVARVILFSESKSNREHLLMFRRTCQVGEFVMELSTEE